MTILEKNNFVFYLPRECILLDDQQNVLSGNIFNVLNKTKSGYVFIYSKKNKNILAFWLFSNYFLIFFLKNHLIFVKKSKQNISESYLASYKKYFYRNLYDFFGFSQSILHFVGVGYKIIRFKKRRKFKIFFWLGFCTWQVLRLKPRLILSPDKESFRLLSLKLLAQNYVYLSYFKNFVKNIRPSEPYKGKGIRFMDEIIKRKPGKTGRL